jgi:hypothetical protein
VLGGFQFVVAAGIFLGEGRSRRGLGALYAIDLLGGCAGALVLSGFLIPVYGFWPTAWLTAMVNLAAVAAAASTGLGWKEGSGKSHRDVRKFLSSPWS